MTIRYQAAPSDVGHGGSEAEPPLSYMSAHGFKKAVFCVDQASGLRAIIAIHSTLLGPANGGVRMWDYRREEDAVVDALRLARGMTYKWAAAGMARGGGKAVILGDPKTHKTEALLRAFGRAVDQLAGEFYAGADVGMTLADMETVYAETDYVATLPEHLGGPGDISPVTAFGVLQGMRACAWRVWGSPDLAGRRVAVQGLGACGSNLMRLLLDQDAIVTVADIEPERLAAAATGDRRVITVAPAEIYHQDVDIFAPCALGGVLNDATVPLLRARVVCGSANNVLAAQRHGDELERRGIVYAPDYIVNAGGAIYDAHQFVEGGFRKERAMSDVARIYERTVEVFEIAGTRQVTAQRAADMLAERRLAEAAPGASGYRGWRPSTSPDGSADGT